MLRKFALLALMLFAGSVLARPDVTLLDTTGKQHKLSDYQGKWIVLNYWATWCPPCRKEMPELLDFHERHKDTDAVVLAVNTENISSEKLQKFIDDYKLTFPVFPRSEEIEAVAPLRGLPTTYLINPQGEMVAKQSGAVTAEGIESFIRGQ